MKKKLLYINNFEAPYRMPFYNCLGEYYDMTLALSQHPEDRTERNSKWFQNSNRTYKLIYLDSVQIGSIKIGFSVRKILSDYDLIFMDMYGNLTNMYAICCLHRMKIPFIMSVDGMLRKDSESFIVRQVKKFCLSVPLKILSPGDSVDACLENYGVPQSKLIRYYFTSLQESDILTSVPTIEEKNRLRKKLGMESKAETKVIITVGRFTYNRGYGKGYDVIMKAMCRLPSNYQLYIIGDNPTQEFVDMKLQMGLENVHFIGFMSKSELNEYYRAADLFCLQTRGDIWGLVVNEAMAAGLPVITTKSCVAGLTLVQNGVNGYISDAEDSIALEDNIRKILDDDNIRKNMSEASIRIIRNWTIDEMVRQHVEAFNKVL